MCRSTPHSYPNKPRINSIEPDTDTEINYYTFPISKSELVQPITNETRSERPTVQVDIDGTIYEMLEDTGATVSVMTEKQHINLNLKPKKKPSHVTLKPCGRNTLSCKNQFDAILKSGHKKCCVTVYIVSEEDLSVYTKLSSISFPGVHTVPGHIGSSRRKY